MADGTNLYLATVIDCCSRRLAGWAVADHMRTRLVEDALKNAAATRGNLKGAIFHSDHGSVGEYTSLRLTEHLALEEIRPSIGSVGDCDNALMESINGLYKAECIRTTVFHDGPSKTIADVEYATAGWVDWYNNRRLHSSLGNVPPVEYEQAHYAALNRRAAPRIGTAENLGRFSGWAPAGPVGRRSADRSASVTCCP